MFVRIQPARWRSGRERRSQTAATGLAPSGLASEGLRVGVLSGFGLRGFPQPLLEGCGQSSQEQRCAKHTNDGRAGWEIVLVGTIQADDAGQGRYRPPNEQQRAKPSG